MKKIFSLILATFMLISNTCVIFANDSTEFYAYTSDTTGYDEYTKSKLGEFIYTYYGFMDTSIELGKGILVNFKQDNPTVLYPIWKSGKIIATFKVSYVNGIYSGTYTESNACQLDALKSIASKSNPMSLVSQDGLYALVDGVAYDLNGEIGVKSSIVLIESIPIENMEIVNVKDTSGFDQFQESRAVTSFTNEWTTYYQDTSFETHCYTFCLYNIFRNLGITEYTFQDIRTGILNGAGVSNISSIVTYLKNNGFSYSYQTSGYASISTIRNIIYNNDNYIMTGLTYLDGKNVGKNHFMALYGYASASGTNIYRVWDPQSSGSGKLVIDGNTMTVTDSNAVTLKWDAGFIGCFKK